MNLEKAIHHGEHGAHGGKPGVKASEPFTGEATCFRHCKPYLFAVSAVFAVWVQLKVVEVFRSW
jgi:hypothetical protein